MAPYILGMGNPLLDISSTVDKAFVEKYKVPLGAACLADESQMPMYKELAEMKSVEYIAGGATLNAIRVAKWKLGKAGQAGYMGAIGKDDFGETLQTSCKKSGVETCFMVNSEVATGTCAVGILDKERGLVANLAAANTYSNEHFTKNQGMIQKADIVYSAGFFITVSPESMVQAAETAHKTGAVYCLNLAAPFIMQAFKDKMLPVLKLSDYVFGNETEAKTFGEVMGCATDATSVAKHIAGMPTADGRMRTCVITQGADKSVVARSDGFYMEVPVAKLDQEKLVDTNAAGDAFVGGFLAAVAMNKGMEECVLTGHETARYIIQRSGCSMEGTACSRLE